MEVQRFDLARVSLRTRRTPQGFLKAPAFFTRAGIFEYKRQDGTTVRELRPPEEVFHKDSLLSMQSAPITRDHPSSMVTLENAKDLSIGMLSDNLERKDNKIGGEVTIFDSKAVADIEKGNLCEFSMGYKCRIDSEAGLHPEFGRYDAIQRDIRYNHAAMGGKNWGRAGSDISLRLDSEGAAIENRKDAFFSGLERLIWQKADLLGLSFRQLSEKLGLEPFELDSYLMGWAEIPEGMLQKIASAVGVDVEELRRMVPKMDRSDSKKGKKSMEMEKITIGGVEFEAPKAAVQAFNAELSRLDSEKEKVQGRCDSVEEELKGARVKIAELEDSSRFDSAVNARLELVEKARKVLGDEAELEAGRRGLMEQVLKHDKKDLDLSGKSDDYVEARFDAFIENHVPGPKAASDKLKSSVDNVINARQDSNRSDSAKARERMQEKNQEAWKTGNRDRLLGVAN